ncbi:hypothetical protein, partial [Merismopedia glauca]
MNSETAETPEPIFPVESEIRATDLSQEETVESEILAEELALNLPETPEPELELNLAAKEPEEVIATTVTPKIMPVAELEYQEQLLRESIEKLQLEYE